MTRELILGLVFAVLLPGQMLLVLQKGDSTLGFYGPDGRKFTSIPVGKHPHEMVISADGRYVYMTDNGTMQIEQEGTGGNTVSVADLLGRTAAPAISLGEFRRPHGIDLDKKTGLLYITTELPDRLLVVDPVARKVLRTFDTKGKTSHIVTLRPDGKFAYVSNSSSANVAAIDTAAGTVRLIPTGSRPEGSALSADGKLLYVANRNGKSITIIDTQSNAAAGTIATGDGPNRIAVTPDGGKAVYSLYNENKVEVADTATRKVIGQVQLPEQPVSLTLSNDGKTAYASAQYKDLVYAIDIANLKIKASFGTNPGGGPDPVLEHPKRY